ncbi:MAG: deoxyribodipyrimidine photo-lyase [Bacillota bacterium]
MKIEKIFNEIDINKDYYSILNDKNINNKEDYILYWMQNSQRLSDNRAISIAARVANLLNKKLYIIFNFISNYPESNYRHYSFMYEGIKEIHEELNNSGIRFIITIGDFRENIKKWSDNSSITFTDKGYLKPQRSWRVNLSKIITVPLVEISTDTVVPIQKVSNKEEYAAYTIRKKINKYKNEELFVWELPEINNHSDLEHITPEYFYNKDKFLSSLNLKDDLPEIKSFTGGYSQAKSKLESFVNNKLTKYQEKSNDPDLNVQSNLSPYLHFGQISPREIALFIKDEAELNSDIKIEDFLEQLIIRRELSFNFVYYNKLYDSYPEALPEWAKETLEIHAVDPREYIYSKSEFENAETHDYYWNTAQLELIYTGKIHNYMRMYWGKKILEWSLNPETAFNIALYLNNKYSLDGRDPNSYAGIAWCFGKHDRAWQERDIFGKTRYMNQNGLKRKFKMEKYIERIKNISGISKIKGVK